MVANRWHLELTAGFFLEAWDLNLYKEQLIGGAITFNRRMTPNWTVGVEAGLLHVNQDPIGERLSAHRVPHAAVERVPGRRDIGVPRERRRCVVRLRRGAEPRDTLQPDLSERCRDRASAELTESIWSAVCAGCTCRTTVSTGRDHNPDIQALGLYAGWRVN